MAMANDMLTEVRFWSMVIENARHTVVCSPENESRIKGWLDARGYGLITVKVSPVCPDDRVYVIDCGAIEAGEREYLQSHPFRFRY